MNITINVSKENNIDKYKKVGANAFIFGLKDFNVSANLELDTSQIKKITEKNPDIDIFISIDKNIFNHELQTLKEKLLELAKINIKAIMFYDLAILNIIKENNLKIDLVWNQTHMVTNYNTCNYYYDKGVKYGCLSSEITLEEIIQINRKSNMEVMVYLVGYPYLSHSRRKLLTNFYMASNYQNKDQNTVVSEKENKFIIKETNAGTSILGGTIINGTIFLDKLIDNNISFIILNDYMIEEDTFTKIVDYTNQYIKTKNKDQLQKIETLIGNNTHFFNKKTIYKVKKDK